MKKTTILAFAGAAVLFLAALPMAAQQPPAAKPDFGPLVGIWALEINAGGEYYYLTLDFKLVEGKLEGAMSEQNGTFTNLPVRNVEWDNAVLKFDFMSPTPPDGVERQIKTELKLAEGKLEGTMTIPDLGMTVSVSGSKK
jgi:hypothetical protein